MLDPLLEYTGLVLVDLLVVLEVAEKSTDAVGGFRVVKGKSRNIFGRAIHARPRRDLVVEGLGLRSGAAQ